MLLNANLGQKDWETQPRFREIWPIWAKLDNQLRDILINFIRANYGGRVCWDVATVLSYIADPRVIEPLGTFLSDENSQVRAKAVTALGRLGNSRSIPLLSQAIKDADPRVRSSAITALSEFGEIAVRSITNALRDMDTGVRYSTAAALGKLGNPQSLNALLWIQQHDKSAANDTRVKEAISVAIKRIRQRQGQSEARV